MKAFLLGLARNRFAWMVLAVLVAAGVYFVVGRGGSDKLTYETQAVDRGSIETSVASSGSVTPLITVTVGSEVSGKLVDVLVDFNAKVKKGQLMARIDPSTFQSRVDSAHADLVVQKATVGQRQVDVDNSQVILDQSKRDLDRTKALYEKGLMSSNDMEKARNAQDQAQNNLKLAQAALANARSQVIKMQASLDQMQLDLSRTQIRAPVDGVVINRAVDPGQTVAAQMQAPTLFQVAQDLSQIKIETKVDEADIGSIKAGARATFTVDAYPDRTFNGSVAQVRINGTSSQNVVTYSVMVQANNPGLVLLPGMTANVKIITAERANVLRVASAALRFRPAGAPALPSADGGRGAQGGGPGGGGPPGGFGGGPPGGGPPGGFGGGGGGQQRSTTRPARQMVQMTPEVMKELGLSPDQQSKVTEAMKEVMQRTAQSSAGSGTSNPLGGGGGGPGGGGFRGFFGNNANDAQLMRQRMVNSLSNILTEEQLQKYLAMGAANAVRPGTVYVLNAKGQPEARTVRVGLSTDANTELLAGLNEGDKVIVRARSATAEKK